MKSPALILSLLLLMSTGLVTATDNDVSVGIVEAPNEGLKIRVESLLKEVKEMIEYAEELIEQAGDIGINIQIYREILETASSKYDEALELYRDGDYNKAFSVLMYAKTRAQIVIRSIQGLVGGGPIGVEEELNNELKHLENKYKHLKSLVEQGAYDKSLRDLLKQLEDLLNKAQEMMNKNIHGVYSILEKIRSLINQVEDIVGEKITTTITQTVEEETRRNIETVKTLPTPPHTIVETRPTFTTLPQEFKNKTRGEVEVGLEKRNGTYRVVVERVEHVVDYGNGTILIVRERVISIGNKTTISISKELLLGKNESKSVAQVSIEHNQSIVGAFFKISSEKHEVLTVDQKIEAHVIQVERNRVKVRLKAPDNFPGKLFIIEISPEIVDLQNIMNFNLTVNGEEAILASSLLDLASGAYDRPAYVFIISSKGVQILLYIPHFSEYIVEINAVLQKILELFKESLNQIFSKPMVIATTIIATIILLSSATITLRQKKILSKLK
ncbi:MAG: hypothetical protein NZ929_02905 [Aigarchaeota archaeon]|nr:hypothetical protein [Aigarchaeota archaeon]